MAGIFSTILTSSGRYLAGIFKSEDSPGWYFWTNLDYWPVFLDQFGLLAGIFEVWIVLASIFVKIWTSPMAGIFTSHDSHWPVFFDKFGLVLNFGWY